MLRNRKAHAAVARLDVEPFSAPGGAVEFDVDTSVRRTATNVAADVCELHAPVGRPELDASFHVPDVEAAVRRLERQVHLGWNRDLIAHVPALAPAEAPRS